MNSDSDTTKITSAAEIIGPFLQSFLHGEFSSATLSFNEENGPNYQSVQQCDDDGHSCADWISEDERVKGRATNSRWTFHWYSHTPVGFCALSASTLPALIAALAAIPDRSNP